MIIVELGSMNGLRSLMNFRGLRDLVGIVSFRGILLLIYSLSLLFVTSCQESLEEKAERDAKEYTRRYCPTPIINSTRTDSISFSKIKRVYTYHISFVGELDNEELIKEHEDEIVQMLGSSLRESTSMKPYIEAGFKFEYICRSASNKTKILLQTRLN